MGVKSHALCSPNSRKHNRKRQPDHKYRKRYRHHVRVQVREQECEERELRYFMPRRVRRHHPAASPEVELAERSSGQHILDALPYLYRAIEIAQHRNERHADQSPLPPAPSAAHRTYECLCSRPAFRPADLTRLYTMLYTPPTVSAKNVGTARLNATTGSIAVALMNMAVRNCPQ